MLGVPILLCDLSMLIDGGLDTLVLCAVQVAVAVCACQAGNKYGALKLVNAIQGKLDSFFASCLHCSYSCRLAVTDRRISCQVVVTM